MGSRQGVITAAVQSLRHQLCEAPSGIRQLHSSEVSVWPLSCHDAGPSPRLNALSVCRLCTRPHTGGISGSLLQHARTAAQALPCKRWQGKSGRPSCTSNLATPIGGTNAQVQWLITQPGLGSGPIDLSYCTGTAAPCMSNSMAARLECSRVQVRQQRWGSLSQVHRCLYL